MTLLEWHAFQLFNRADYFSLILNSGKLTQEILVDMYVCVEHGRLDWMRRNQKTIRADLYHGALEAMGNDDEEQIGRALILPSTFIGGPRYKNQLFHDAMSLVTEFGKPAYFITMTANPMWPEIQAELLPHQTAMDWPDLVARVFHVKFHELLDDVTKRGRLGVCLAHVYTVEFQKRGLPHTHTLLIMDHKSTPRSAEGIDQHVSAEIPDKTRSPQLHEAVGRFMLHGPCRADKCKTADGCKLGFPKAFRDSTDVPENAYPNYQRRAGGPTYNRCGIPVDCSMVVPYNAFLLLKFNCHINVEISASIQAVKYIFKYISKGQDRARLDLVGGNEVLAFLDAWYIGAAEGECVQLDKL